LVTIGALLVSNIRQEGNGCARNAARFRGYLAGFRRQP
jgi:hypothetical protein